MMMQRIGDSVNVLRVWTRPSRHQGVPIKRKANDFDASISVSAGHSARLRAMAFAGVALIIVYAESPRDPAATSEDR